VCRTPERNTSPEVEITGVSFANPSSSSLRTPCKEVSHVHDQCNESNYERCRKLNFELGSTSRGKMPRGRARRITRPNSYYRDFELVDSNARTVVGPEHLQLFECLAFYGQHHGMKG
jgi:hypothetical protein